MTPASVRLLEQNSEAREQWRQGLYHTSVLLFVYLCFEQFDLLVRNAPHVLTHKTTVADGDCVIDKILAPDIVCACLERLAVFVEQREQNLLLLCSLCKVGTVSVFLFQCLFVTVLLGRLTWKTVIFQMLVYSEHLSRLGNYRRIRYICDEQWYHNRCVVNTPHAFSIVLAFEVFCSNKIVWFVA